MKSPFLCLVQRKAMEIYGNVISWKETITKNTLLTFAIIFETFRPQDDFLFFLVRLISDVVI